MGKPNGEGEAPCDTWDRMPWVRAEEEEAEGSEDKLLPAFGKGQEWELKGESEGSERRRRAGHEHVSKCKDLSNDLHLLQAMLMDF